MTTVNRRKPNQPPKADDKRFRANRNQPPANVKQESGLPELLDHQRMALSVPESAYLGLVGGRGGGKSFTLAVLLIRDALRYGKKFNGALLRTDLAGLKKLQLLIEDLANKIPQLAGSRYLTGSKRFEFSNGAVLVLHYIKDDQAFARFQGEDISHFAIDELGQIAEPAPILRMLSSLRSPHSDVTCRFYFTANPGNIGSYFIYETLICRSSPWIPFFSETFQHEFVLGHSTVFDNSHIDTESYAATLKASANNDPAKILSELYGDWAAPPASFFGHSLSEQRSRIPWIGPGLVRLREFRPSNLWLGLDFGVKAPSAVVLAYRTPEGITLPDGRYIAPRSVILLDEYYSCLREKSGQRRWELGDASLTVQTLARAITDLCERNAITLNTIPLNHRIADAQIGAVTGGMDGSIGNQLAKFGCRFAAGPKGSRATGWALMATLMSNAGAPDVPGLFATERMESFWATAPLAQHDTSKQDDLVLNADHCLDAIRYMLMATMDSRYRGRNGGPTNVRIW